VTGRLKNLIVLASGKKVNPEEVETLICRSALVKEVCVLGKISQAGLMRGTEEVCAVVVPSEPVAGQSKQTTEISERIKDEIALLSQDLAIYKRPSKVVIRFEDLPKTTTRKIKRTALIEWLAEQEAVPAEATLLG